MDDAPHPSAPDQQQASARPARRHRVFGAAALPMLFFVAVLVALPGAGPKVTYLRTVAGHTQETGQAPGTSAKAQPAQAQPAQAQPAQGQPNAGVQNAKTATTGPVQRIEQGVSFHVPGAAVRTGMIAYAVLVLLGLGLFAGFLLRRRGESGGASVGVRRSWPVSPAYPREPVFATRQPTQGLSTRDQPTRDESATTPADQALAQPAAWGPVAARPAGHSER